MKNYYISELPPFMEDKDKLKLYAKAYEIQRQIRNLDLEINRTLVNQQIMNGFTIHEALESTRIEGTQTTMHELFESEVTETDSQDITEVLNYVRALNLGRRLVTNDGFIANRTIKAIHEELLKGNVRGSHMETGSYRRINNWLGGPGSTQETASYIPPSHIEINDHMENLENYINNHEDTMPTLIKVAIIHAQFESIHPFMDGNGRVGRMLIPLYFMLKDEATLSQLFISKELEENKYQYYNLLNGTREENPQWFYWIDFFLDSISRSIVSAEKKYKDINKLYDKYSIKEDHNYMKVLDAIFMHPIVTVSNLVSYTGLSRPTITKALNRMIDVRMIFHNDSQRNKKYYFYELINLM